MSRIFRETKYRVLADEEAMRADAVELRSEIKTAKQVVIYRSLSLWWSAALTLIQIYTENLVKLRP